MTLPDFMPARASATDFFANHNAGVPIHLVSSAQAKENFSALPPHMADVAKSAGFIGNLGAILPLYENGALSALLVGMGAQETPFFLHPLHTAPASDYVLGDCAGFDPILVALGFSLSAYRFDMFKKPSGQARAVRLHIAALEDYSEVVAITEALALGRDLVNLPPNILGPDGLEAVGRSIATALNASVEIVKGKDLEDGYPLIHAVGKASAQMPRLMILRLPSPRLNAPKIALVGKGVTFDSGGLDIKPASGMALMKKDMGGAACVLSLFSLLSRAKIDAEIACYVPIVENAIGGAAFRPGDIYKARNGLHIEIDNTDAEGRLILADALTRACEDGADVVVDMATLTGAARVALGPEITPFFTNDSVLAAQLRAASAAIFEPLWEMPLYKPYLSMLDAHDADMKNSGSGGFAGSMTAALFLEKFVAAKQWVHFDTYCWNPQSVPTRPKHGDVHGVRALYYCLRQQYGAN